MMAKALEVPPSMPRSHFLSVSLTTLVVVAGGVGVMSLQTHDTLPPSCNEGWGYQQKREMTTMSAIFSVADKA